MISGIDLNATVDFVFSKDNTENPTTWKLGALPSSLFFKFQELFGSGGGQSENMVLLVRLSLRGWENSNLVFTQEEEKIFGVKRQVVPLATMDQIHSEIISEMALKCLEINKLSVDERKN